MNLRQKPFTILFLTLGVLFISAVSVRFSFTLASNTHDSAIEATNHVDQRLKEAFVAVREAEAAGVEGKQIKDFVDRLNFALNLTEQNATQAITIFDQVKAEAYQLRDAASQASFLKKTFIFSMVPVAALIVTICVHYGLKLVRQNKVEQTMKMKIREKGKTKNV